MTRPPRYKVPWTHARVLHLIASKGYIDYHNYQPKDDHLRKLCLDMRRNKLVAISRVDRSYYRVTKRVTEHAGLRATQLEYEMGSLENGELIEKIEAAVKAEFEKLKSKLHNLFDDHGNDTHESLDTIVNETHDVVKQVATEHVEVPGIDPTGAQAVDPTLGETANGAAEPQKSDNQ